MGKKIEGVNKVNVYIKEGIAGRYIAVWSDLEHIHLYDTEIEPNKDVLVQAFVNKELIDALVPIYRGGYVRIPNKRGYMLHLTYDSLKAQCQINNTLYASVTDDVEELTMEIDLFEDFSWAV